MYQTIVWCCLVIALVYQADGFWYDCFRQRQVWLNAAHEFELSMETTWLEPQAERTPLMLLRPELAHKYVIITSRPPLHG